jgi:hypothetical protein
MYYIVKKAVPLRDFPSSKVGNVVKKLSIGTLVTADDCGKFVNTELGKTYLPVIMDGSRLWAHDAYLQQITPRQAAAIKHGESWLGRKPQTKAIAWYNSTEQGAKDPKKKENYCTVGALWAAAQGTDLGDLIARTAAKCEAKAKEKGLWHAKDSDYNPKPGDLVLFKGKAKNSASHTELLVLKVGNVLHTINYNADKVCKRQERKVSDNYTYGYIDITY